MKAILAWGLRFLGTPEPPLSRLLGFCALLAFVAGGLRAAMTRTPATTWKDVLLAGAASSLSGYVTVCLCLYCIPAMSVYLLSAIAGVAGWLGITILDLLAAKALAFIKDQTK